MMLKNNSKMPQKFVSKKPAKTGKPEVLVGGVGQPKEGGMKTKGKCKECGKSDCDC